MTAFAAISTRSATRWRVVYLEGLEFIPAGDKVMAVASLRARGRSTGIEAEQRAFLVWTLRDGLVIGLEAFPERAEALEAARLEE